MTSDGLAVAAVDPGPAGCRRFGISDAMILTAGVAVVLSGSLHFMVLMVDTYGRLAKGLAAYGGGLPWQSPVVWQATRGDLRNTLLYGYGVAEVMTIGLAPFWLAIRLKAPRPPRAALFRQPGLVAALAMVFGFFWGNGALVSLWPSAFAGGHGDAMIEAVGGSVALAWVGLAMGRRWRAERGWIDRSGRCLGVAAMVLAPLLWLILKI